MADEVKLTAKSFEPLDRSKHLDSEKISAPNLTFMQDAWRRLKKNKSAVIAMVILILFFIMAILSFFPSVLPHQPNAINTQYANLPPKWPGVDINGVNGTLVQGGSRINAYAQAGAASNVHFWLGTDYLGRDLLSRILTGTRISLTVAVVATLVDLLFGVTYGMFSGWKGGRVDNFMQRLIEIIMSIPTLVIVVLLMLILKPGMWSIILTIAFSSWTTMARLTRAQTLELKEQEYILAARTLGESPIKIAFKHLLPNLSSIIIIQTMFTIPSAIFFEAFLSFVGIGIPNPTASLGTLLNDGQKNFQFLPYQMWYPAIVLSIIMIAFNVFADGLRDAFDPQTKE
ncbi:ABC transporter permease subunit [Secundilactobacillus kimchicus]|uniref:ABC transporter permease n=1 Tax=Secundilactobacillus kimchicus TaxID=528209 RepID=UPI001C01B76A|nr:ABC transporter permease [Secundilactobacillus kimchicus]MBT9671972.1 ABC transporter permease subunit [Secundilactobacillus kimchicus]